VRRWDEKILLRVFGHTLNLRLRIPSCFITSGTEYGTMPKSSPQTSILVDALTRAVFHGFILPIPILSLEEIIYVKVFQLLLGIPLQVAERGSRFHPKRK